MPTISIGGGDYEAGATAFTFTTIDKYVPSSELAVAWYLKRTPVPLQRRSPKRKGQWPKKKSRNQKRK